jgi:hypothetical protein
MMAKFGSLWIGPSLSKIQVISLSSFVYYGHDLTLYVYDLDLPVPQGIRKADAREIIEEEEIFKVQNQYAAFSDVFRYRMINKTGLAWVDADTICLTKEWEFKDNTYAGLEGNTVVGGVLSLPQNSEALRFLIKKSTNFDKTKIKWTDIGPALVNKAFRLYNLMNYVYDEKTFCGIHFSEWKKLWDPNYRGEIKLLEKTAKSISVYNSMVTRSGIDKEFLPKGSAMEYFYQKFVIRKWD